MKVTSKSGTWRHTWQTHVNTLLRNQTFTQLEVIYYIDAIGPLTVIVIIKPQLSITCTYDQYYYNMKFRNKDFF